MADESRKRISVVLTDPTNEKKTFTLQLRRFTPQNFEEYSERDMDDAGIMARVRDKYAKVQKAITADENSDIEDEIEAAKEARRVITRTRLITEFRQLQWMIDPEQIKIDQHRDWINEDPEDETGFWFHQQDMAEVEGAIGKFRDLLGIKDR
jgi:hypothetical protein